MYDAPEPTIGPNDVKIKVQCTGICGTDIHIYKWDEWAQRTVPVPMTTGHEFVGVVSELGDHVEGLQLGQRVSGEGHITCGYCRSCRAGRRHLCHNTIGTGVNRTGAFAEYIVMPASNVFPIPDEVPNRIAAILDPFGNATYTTLAFNVVGEDILITGAGPVGMMAVAIAKHAGARHVVITDVNDYRLALARQMGATRAVNITQTNLKEVMQDLGIGEGFDVGLEMSGNSKAFNQMLDIMNHAGNISLLGIFPDKAAINFDHVVFKGLTIKGIYGREMFETWYKMISMLQSGINIAPVITHEFSIDDFQKGFDTMLSGQSGKVILHWE